jgi:putative FmdB family regulatory protein
MPLYEYRCAKCGKVFEVMQKFSDAPVETHEGCGGAVERLISAPAFHLKGSGWYATDYAKGSSSKPEGKTGENKGDSKSGDKGDSKSGDKGDSKSGESKGDSKSAESKTAETKTESKPAAD